MRHFFLSLFLTTSAVAQAGKNNDPSPKPNLRITTNAPQAVIFGKQGQLGQISNGGTLNIHVESGWSDITIKGDGFVERNIKTFVPGSDMTDLFIEVAGQQAQGGIAPSGAPETYNFRLIKDTPSHCSDLIRMTPKSQHEKLFCRPKSLYQEFRNLGVTLTPGLDAAEPSIRPLVTEFKSMMRYKWYPSLQVKSEQILAGIASNALGFEAAMISSLWGEDCQRILSLATDASRQGVSSANLTLITGLCFQLAGKPREAIAGYKPLFDQTLNSKNDFSVSKIYWHLAVLQIAQSPEDAIKTLESCVLSNPWFKPCSLLLHDLYISKGFLKKATLFKKKLDQQAETSLLPIIDNTINLMKNKQFSKVADNLSRLSQTQETFEVRWLKLLNSMEHHKDIRNEDIYLATNTYVMTEKTALRVMKLIAKTNNLTWTEQALRSVTRDFPNNGYFWAELGQLLFDQNRCRDVITLLDQVKVKSKKEMAAISELTGRCYITLKDFDNGIQRLKALTSQAPFDWRSHYHLAEGFAKAGRITEALSSYDEALSHKPPQKIFNEINTKIKELK